MLFASGMWPWVFMILRFANKNEAKYVKILAYLMLYWSWTSLIVFFMAGIDYFIEGFSLADIRALMQLDKLILYCVQFFCSLALVISLIQLLWRQDYYHSRIMNWLGVQLLYDEKMTPPIYSILPFLVFNLWCLSWICFVLNRDGSLFNYLWVHYSILIICIMLTLGWLTYLAYSWFARRSDGKAYDI